MTNLPLIDWPHLAANALWILGLGLALAAFSFAGYQANTARQKLGAVLKETRYDRTLNLAGILFCTGLAAASSRLYEIIPALLLAALFLANLVISARKKPL